MNDGIEAGASPFLSPANDRYIEANLVLLHQS
jgi:hypothetical protein